MISCTLTINDTIYDVNPVFGDNVTLEREREDDEMYFTEKLGGEFKFIGRDFDLIESQGLGQDFLFSIYDDTTLFAETTFYKTDCTFDYDSKMVSVKMEAHDLSSKLREGLDNEYNIVRLAPERKEITYSKRPILQLYMLGDKKIVNIIGNMSYEVDAEVEIGEFESLDERRPEKMNKYHLIDLYSIVYMKVEGEEEYSGMYFDDSGDYRAAEEGSAMQIATTPAPFVPRYRIDYEWEQTQGEEYDRGWFYLRRISDNEIIAWGIGEYGIYEGEVIMHKQDESTFIMDIGCRSIAGRILNDKEGYDRNLDDDIYFQNLNYRKVYTLPRDQFIALIGDRFISSAITQDEPTEWGQASGEEKYFVKPIVQGGGLSGYDRPNVVPMGRSIWGYMSTWFVSDINWANYLDNRDSSISPILIEDVQLKDAYPLHSAIQVLLNKIDPTITFQPNSNYSHFFYDNVNPIDGIARDIYVTPITNIKKTYYNQAAQRGDITLGQIFEMLKGAYQCYWWVDESKRLRIEHISYFRNGGSYTTDSRVVRADLTSIFHPRNNKSWSFSQNVISYDKNQMYGRYEYKWGDDLTPEFNGDALEILSNWVSKGKIKRYNIANFVPDIDYIVASTDSVSDDCFALIEVNRTTQRTFIGVVGLGSQDSTGVYRVMQNGYLSFLYLVPTYHLYNLSGDMALYYGWLFDIDNIFGIARWKKQSISFPFTISGAREDGLIKTDMGEGEIRKITLNLSSKMAQADIYYDTE